MVSLGFSSLRARRRIPPPADVQATAQEADIVHCPHAPLIEELVQSTGLPDLEEDGDNDGVTVVDVSTADPVEPTQDGDDDDDDDDDDAATTPSSSLATAMTTSLSSSATATVFPTTFFSQTLTTTLPTVSSSRIESATWLTGIPVQTGPASTSTRSCELAAVEQPTLEPGGHRDDDDSPGPPRPNSTGTKVAIAFGAIGAIGLIVALIWAAILIRRRRRRHGLDEANPRDYPSRIGQHPRFRFNFNIPPFPRLPFSFASPLVRFTQPDPKATPRQQMASPSKPPRVSGHRNVPPDSSNLNENPQAADRTDGGEIDTVPRGWLDEKRHDPGYPLPLLDPEPVQQASIRRSVVSWFQRSSKHHPLRLNPLQRKSSLASATSSLTEENLMSRTGSMATTSRADIGYHTGSRESVVAEGSGSDSRDILDELPPMSDLGLQGMYTNDPPTTPALAGSAAVPIVTAPPAAFTREDARAYYRSMWAESSAGNTERMSAMSSWTDSTMRTSTHGGAGRESIEQAGLSPPPGHANPYDFQITSQTPVSSVTTPATMWTGNTTGGPGTPTRNREESYAVYEQRQEGNPNQ